MKTIIKFDDSNPEDIKGLKRAIKATDMAIVLFEIKYNLRKKIDSSIPKNVNQGYTIDYVFDEIRDLLEENAINIDDLID